MNSSLALILSNLSSDLKSLDLGIGFFGQPAVAFPSDATAILGWYNMLIFLKHS